MNKAILVIDMPDSCFKCHVCASYKASAFSSREYWCATNGKDVDPNSKPDWCPLKPVPRMRFTYIGHDDEATANYNSGWNDCLEKIKG